MKLIAFAGLLASTVAAQAAHQELYFADGNKLLQACTAPTADQRFYCAGYAQGIVDALGYARAAFETPYCVPPGVITEQVVDVIIKYLRDHAQWRQHAASQLAIQAISEAWCPAPPPATNTPAVNYK